RRRDLDDPRVVVEGEVGVEPPAEAFVEGLRSLHVCDGEHRHFKAQRRGRGTGNLRRSFSTDLRTHFGASNVGRIGTEACWLARWLAPVRSPVVRRGLRAD